MDVLDVVIADCESVAGQGAETVRGSAWTTMAVTELERSVSCHQDVFGPEALMSNAATCAVDEADRFAFLIEPRGLFVLGMELKACRDGQPLGPSRAGLSHVALAVVSDRLADHQCHLGRRGVAYRFLSGTVAEPADPDGKPVVLFDPYSHPSP